MNFSSGGDKLSPSKQRAEIEVIAGFGIKDNYHAGATRKVGGREGHLKKIGFVKGHPILNTRQFSAISQEELMEISTNLGLPEMLEYGLLNENLVVSGIPNFSQLPPQSLLVFKPPGIEWFRSSILIVNGANVPCLHPGEVINSLHPLIPANEFPRAATRKKGETRILIRGVVGMVYSSGIIEAGDEVHVIG